MRFILLASLLMSAVSFAAPKNNEPAPPFAVKAADGKEYKLGDFKGKTVVLEWFNPDCPYVRKHYNSKNMQGLQEQAKKDGTIWLTVASNAAGKEGHLTQKDAAKIYADRGMASTALLLDDKAKMATAYHATTTPHMFIIDKEGKLVYQGAIDDKPSASEKTLAGADNYVKRALAALAKNEKPNPDSTTPYGCSVKY
jgi:peroxiredoxin